MSKNIKVMKVIPVLTLAGSDPSGGAGVQADIKVFSMHGAFALSVITALTAQNTRGVTKVYEVPLSMIEAQMDALFTDFNIVAVKTGMLSSSRVVHSVAEQLWARKIKNLVVDPVILSKNGYPLLNSRGIRALQFDLIPLACLVTPNVDEAEILSGMPIRSLADMEKATRMIFMRGGGCRAVLVKGGDLRQKGRGTDILYDGQKITRFKADYIRSPHTHGTGCVYSAAIAVHLALGESLHEAIQKSKSYVTETIRQGLPMGHGKGPVNPCYGLLK